MIFDFTDNQTNLLLNGLITQKIVDANDSRNVDICKDDVLGISINGLELQDYCLQVCKVSVTDFDKISNEDINRNGFIYPPNFYDFLRGQGFDEHSVLLKVDFKLLND